MSFQEIIINCNKQVPINLWNVPSRLMGKLMIFCYLGITYAWVKVFRIIPEFRILRLTFHRKSASKC